MYAVLRVRCKPCTHNRVQQKETADKGLSDLVCASKWSPVMCSCLGKSPVYCDNIALGTFTNRGFRQTTVYGNCMHNQDSDLRVQQLDDEDPHSSDTVT